jgi:hypothetical protein
MQGNNAFIGRVWGYFCREPECNGTVQRPRGEASAGDRDSDKDWRWGREVTMWWEVWMWDVDVRCEERRAKCEEVVMAKSSQVHQVSNPAKEAGRRCFQETETAGHSAGILSFPFLSFLSFLSF